MTQHSYDFELFQQYIGLYNRLNQTGSIILRNVKFGAWNIKPFYR